MSIYVFVSMSVCVCVRETGGNQTGLKMLEEKEANFMTFEKLYL